MGIFIIEGGGNWGWREIVGKVDKYINIIGLVFLLRWKI